jgi:hypothetical protein
MDHFATISIDTIRNNSARRILLLTITGPFEKDEDQIWPFLQSTYLAYILAASPIWFWIW